MVIMFQFLMFHKYNVNSDPISQTKLAMPRDLSCTCSIMVSIHESSVVDRKFDYLRVKSKTMKLIFVARELLFQ